MSFLADPIAALCGTDLHVIVRMDEPAGADMLPTLLYYDVPVVFAADPTRTTLKEHGTVRSI